MLATAYNVRLQPFFGLGAQMPLDADAALIEIERLRCVFRSAPMTLGVSIINSILTAIVLSLQGDFLLPAIWSAAIAAVSIPRWVGGRRFLRLVRGEINKTSRWAVISILGSASTGLLWGGGAAVLFPASQSYQLFLAFVVGGMCAGSITVNSAHLPTVLGFILPASLPLAARFAAKGGLGLMSALMLVIFAVSLSLISLNGHRAFGQRVQLRLALYREQRKLGEANERLFNEIAERRSVEATLYQAQKMEALGHLLGGIAHDFNNLIQVIVSNLTPSVIRRLSSGNASIVGYAVETKHAATHDVDLTNSLFTFARRESLPLENVDVNALLQDFEPLLRRAAPPPIQLEIVPKTLISDCRVDPAYFQSAILNLVINARDAMPAGGALLITTSLETVGREALTGNPDASPGQFVNLSVEDTGVGMSKDVLERALEPFFTTKQAGKGSGLGLSQVRAFASQSQGLLRLVSTPGTGTCVTLLLPLAGKATQPETA
ncbi:ATP-binding protein [Rhodopila sp.]|uniref:ATP-binding protein n=1 Tax=Rhodopila sp. TaxID=2480087 RepID=UPI003D108861